LQAEAYAGIVGDADVARSPRSLLAGAVTEGPAVVAVYEVTVEPGTERVITLIDETYGVVEA
jgi:hypothetical protein